MQEIQEIQEIREGLGVKILNGNELIVQGALEAGFSLYTGYPGSPLADYFNILFKKKQDLERAGIKVVLANSEASAAAMASGAKQAGRACLVAMKSMGLHVAADALSVGQFSNPHGGDESFRYPGTVIVVGDDPWSLSTSTPADSRYLFKHLHMPFLQPATAQELKDWMGKALEISQETSLYQGVLLTTFMAEGGGGVNVFRPAAVAHNKNDFKTADFDLVKSVMVPPNSLHGDISMIKERFPKVREAYKKLNLDQLLGHKNSKTGFICAGQIFETLKQFLDAGSYLAHFSLYKLASSYPLVEELLLPWLSSLDHLIIVEEKRGFLEAELRVLMSRHHLKIKIFGKTFPDGPGLVDEKGSEREGFVAYGGLSYEMIRDKVSEIFDLLNLPMAKVTKSSYVELDLAIPKRLPTFCPGCPHRETLSLLKDLRAQLAQDNIDLVSHGDVGCYSLAFLAPFKEMHNLSAMGQGGALGAGLDFFSKNPSVVLMGDSTFFHSGLTNISNSVQAEHNITYILLDNDNTAMTGHQMTPRTGISVEGHKRPKQDMLHLVKNLGVSVALEVNPSDRYYYRNKLRELILKPGVKVIISNKECGLTFHSKMKAQERKLLGDGKAISSKKFYQINTAVCEDCRECVEATGCPGLSQTFDGYGPKITIDPQICVADSYCTKIKVCPSFELVEILDYRPTSGNFLGKIKPQKGEKNSLPEPKRMKTLKHIKGGRDWRVVVTGVGGSGVTTISRVLAEAAGFISDQHLYDFKFMDQKGLAQRNGTVTGHLNLFAKGKSYGAITPFGTADLILSPDLLNGPEALRFLSPDGYGIFDREFQVPMSLLLDRGEEGEPLGREALINQLALQFPEKVHLFDFKKKSFKYFGRSVYASAFLLGYTYQLGGIPFHENELKKAFKKTISKDEYENNWQAFQLGRKYFYCLKKDEFGPIDKAENGTSEHSDLLESVAQSVFFPKEKEKKKAEFKDSLQALRDIFPNYKEAYLAQFIHDLYVFDLGLKMGEFLEDAKNLANLYGPNKNLVTKALPTLVKSYWVKDEVFVAHLMTTPLQKNKNIKMYEKWGRKFKVVHINRPQFSFFGKKVEVDLNPKDWMLHIVKYMRFLRKWFPKWHLTDQQINLKMRKKILQEIHLLGPQEQRRELQKILNIKGYREVKYLHAKKVL